MLLLCAPVLPFPVPELRILLRPNTPTPPDTMAVAETTVAKTVIASPAEFDETVGALTGDVFLLFYGERKEDGDSWCPDCTAAYPIVEGALKARSTPSTLVEVVVKRDEYKGKPDYAYK